MGPRYVTIWDGLSVRFFMLLHEVEGTRREDSKIEWSERWNSAVAGSNFFSFFFGGQPEFWDPFFG